MKVFPHFIFSLLISLSVISPVSAQEYCVPNFQNGSDDEGLRSFQLNTLVNYMSDVPQDKYTVYGDDEFTTWLTTGQSYTLQILSYSGNYEYFKIWIDLNDDFIFSSDELLFQQSGEDGYVNDFITIPNNPAFTGLKRLRVMNGGDNFSSCYWPSQPGEAEDYYVHITDSVVANSYCIPLFEISSPNSLEHFRLNDLYNCASGTSGIAYILYPDSVYTTSLELGKTYPFIIDKGHPSGVPHGLTMYIDFDDDLSFETSEMIANKVSAYSYHGNYTVPNDSSKLGQHRLRVLSASHVFAGSVLPCSYHTFGEAEDYIINIIPAVTDTDTIVPPPVNRWVKVYDFPDYHSGQMINETYDEGYLIMGVTGYNFTPYQLKISLDGDTLWSRAYFPSPISTHSTGTDTTSDGGSVICGHRDIGSFMMKTNACGDIEWLNTYGPEYSEMVDVYQAKNGNYIASTRNFSDSVSNYVNRFGLAEVDTLGALKWFRNYSRYYYAEIGRMMVTSDSGYLINSYAYLPVSGDPYSLRSVIIKTNSEGDVLWESVYDTVNNLICYTHVSEEIPGKGYISLGAATDSETEDFNLSVFFTDYNGVTRWTKPVIDDGLNMYAPTDIMRLNDSTYVILADKFTRCDALDYRIALFTIDTVGNVQNSTSFGETSLKTGSLCRTSNGKFMVVATYDKYGPECSIHAIKFNPDLTVDTIYGTSLTYDSICAAITPVKKIIRPGETAVTLYPNPAHGIVTLEVETDKQVNYAVTIYNPFGIAVTTFPSTRSGRQQLNLRHLTPGLYFVSVDIRGQRYVEKLVVL